MTLFLCPLGLGHLAPFRPFALEKQELDMLTSAHLNHHALEMAKFKSLNI